MSTIKRSSKRVRPAPRRRALAGCAVLLACLAGGILWGWNSLQPGTRIGGPFALMDANGVPTTDRTFRGRFMLVYFGYASCPDMCPATLGAMAGALDRLGPKAARVQPLFITVDPGRDTAEVLRGYVDAIDPRLVALTGPDDAIAAALRAYHVHRESHVPMGHPGSYVVDHSSVLFLMGPDGRLVTPLRVDESPGQMAAAIARHVP